MLDGSDLDDIVLIPLSTAGNQLVGSTSVAAGTLAAFAHHSRPKV